ncbi:MAG: peptidoglycan bridge formation glycyltransferase FemA/FemB family protein [Chloroflexota bacterium]
MPDLAAFRITDRDAWNTFVEHAPYRSFPQLWEWGELRIGSGWRPIRVAVGERPDQPMAGAQVLIRDVPLVGWRLGYAPRGPIGQLDDPRLRTALFAALQDLGNSERIATLKVDPEATADSALGTTLLRSPWRSAAKVQPPRTRLIDLAADEESLLANLGKKHRQYVHKAERAGVTVEHIDGTTDQATAADALVDFNRIYTHTAERAGFVARVAEYYERVWQLFAPAGHARLSFATLDGERVATLFHFTCGDRAAEAYGGMTDAGADSRANYLLKWEAIRAFRAGGFATYDLWGLATGGIAQFKEGFGGRQVDYVGARDLPLRAAQDAALRLLLPAYGIAQRARLRLSGRKLTGSDD